MGWLANPDCLMSSLKADFTHDQSVAAARRAEAMLLYSMSVSVMASSRTAT